jgi:hypothetical protein
MTKKMPLIFFGKKYIKNGKFYAVSFSAFFIFAALCSQTTFSKSSGKKFPKKIENGHF